MRMDRICRVLFDFMASFKRKSTRACLKIHSRHLHALLRGIFGPNSLNAARYAALIWPRSPTKCDAHLTESNFQTRSNDERRGITLRWKVT